MEDLDPTAQLIVDGPLLECWSWKDRPELYSGRHRTTGLSVQVACTLSGTLAWVSAPPRYLVGGPGWSGVGPAAVGTGVLPLSVDDPGGVVTRGSRTLVTADKGNDPSSVRSFAGVGAGAGLSTGWPRTHAARGGTKMDIEDIEVFIGTGRRQGRALGHGPEPGRAEGPRQAPSQ